MERPRRNSTELTILDAIRLAVLPKKHQISAIAAFLLTKGELFSDTVEEFTSYLTSSEDEANEFITQVMVEVNRQLQIKTLRFADRRKLRKSRAMGSQLDMITRVNRLCSSLFGDPSKWLSVGKVTPRIEQPFFNWLRRTQDNTVVAGIDGLGGGTVVTGFVIRERREGPVRFGRLPMKARSLRDLLLCLGLPPQFDTQSVKVEWERRAFTVDGTNRLPWIYP
jgi:hypothetical protein